MRVYNRETRLRLWDQIVRDPEEEQAKNASNMFLTKEALFSASIYLPKIKTVRLIIKKSIQSNYFDFDCMSQASSLISELVAQDLSKLSLGMINLLIYVYSRPT